MSSITFEKSSRKNRKVQRVCVICSTQFYTYPSNVRYHKANFCSKECQYTYMGSKESPIRKPKAIRICIHCNKEFEILAWRLKDPNRGKFCGIGCRRDYRLGEQSANWKGGITPINRNLRSRKVVLDWRKEVLKKDNYTCIWCGATEKLEVDHIKPFATYPLLRAVVSNGRTLCRPCHIKTFTKQKV